MRFAEVGYSLANLVAMMEILMILMDAIITVKLNKDMSVLIQQGRNQFARRSNH